MKKILFVFLTALALAACSSDSGSGSALKPTLVTITVSGQDTQTHTISYDDKNRVQSVVSSFNNIAVTLSYDSKNRVDKLTTSNNYYQFHYGANNKLTSLSNASDTQFPITYISDKTFMLGDFTFTYNANGDLVSFSDVTFAYSGAKGAFANVRNFDAFAFFLADNFSYTFASKKRIVSKTSGTATAYIATEGEKGLPASYTAGDTTIYFLYD